MSVGFEPGSAGWTTAAEDDDWRRAIDVQAELWRLGQARTVRLRELLVAAIAERHRVTVLQYDDYDRIPAGTGQPTQWIVPGAACRRRLVCLARVSGYGA